LRRNSGCCKVKIRDAGAKQVDIVILSAVGLSVCSDDDGPACGFLFVARARSRSAR
jgi:hypothetical protein